MKFRNPIRKRKEDELRYFTECKDLIAEQNLSMQRQTLHILTVLYIILLLLAVLVLDYFSIHPIYYVMFPIIGIFLVIDFATRNKTFSPNVVHIHCATFYCAFFIEIILIDTLHAPYSSAAWFPVLIAVLPMFLIVRFRAYLILDASFLTILLIMSFTHKPESIFFQDVFAGIASICVSLMCAWMMLGVRSKEGLQRYELLRVSKEAEAAREEAEKANAAKSEFLSQMSHELRTPINAILGIDEIILRDFDNEEFLHYAGDIRSAGNTLLSLVNDILDLSKIEAGKMELNETRYDMSFLIGDMYSMIEPRAAKAGLSVNFEIDETIPRFLYGDAARLKQCILNLLTNGVKYTHVGSVTLRMKKIKLDEDKVRLLIEVQDTGIGIRKEDVNHLLAAYERIDLGKNKDIEGTGLGMSIVTKFLNLMGSRLCIDSEYGSGSCFSFTLEQQIRGEEAIGDFRKTDVRITRRTDETMKRFIAPTARVLIVDDTELNLTVAEGLLRPTKMKIDTALSGAAGLRLMQEHVYDLVFSDQLMPEMSGVEFLHAMRALRSMDNENANKPCIALTADAIIGAREKYLAEGFDDYLTKPISGESITKLCAAYLPKEKVECLGEETDGKKPCDMVREAILLEARMGTEEEARDKKAGLDTAAGLANCGDEATYRLALDQFYETIEDKAHEIETYFENEDWENYTIKVHALKSSARIVGAATLSDMALELELAGNGGDLSLIRAKTPDLLSYYRSFQRDDESDVKEENAKDRQEVDPAMLNDAYRSMREFAAQMDIDLMNMVLDTLKDYRLPKHDAAVVAEIKGHLRQLGWEAIDELLQKELQNEKVSEAAE